MLLVVIMSVNTPYTALLYFELLIISNLNLLYVVSADLTLTRGAGA